MLYMMYFGLSVVAVFLVLLTIFSVIFRKKKVLEKVTLSLLLAALGTALYYIIFITFIINYYFPKDKSDLLPSKIATETFREGNILKTCKVRKKEDLNLERMVNPTDPIRDKDPLAAWRLLQKNAKYYDCVEKPYNVTKIIENDLCNDASGETCKLYARYKALFKDKPWFEQSLDTFCRAGPICFHPKELPPCDENGEPKGFCCSIGATYNHSYKACIPARNIISTKPQSKDDEAPLTTLRGCSMPLCNTGNGPDGTGVDTNGHWFRHTEGRKRIIAYHYKDVGLTKK